MDRIRRALDLAREKRLGPSESNEETHPQAAAAQTAHAASAPTSLPVTDKPRPVISIVEKPQPVVSAVESHAPFLSIVDKPRSAVSAVSALSTAETIPPSFSIVEKSEKPLVSVVEAHAPVLRGVEKLRSVVLITEKHQPNDAPTPLLRAPALEPSQPAVSAVEPEKPSREGAQVSGQSDPTVEIPVRTLPTAIRYTRTKTFSPSAAWLESNRIVDVCSANAAAFAFRMLRTQVLQRMTEHNWRSLAILSPGSHDGKTTTAINLAISLANDQQHTSLLVELDFKRPIIAKRLDIDAEIGTDDVLRGSAQVEESMYHPDGFDRFVVMPARVPMDRSSEVLAGPRCRGMVAELHDRYPDRLLIFDLPPVLGADDALSFMPLVECALIVVAEGSTPRADLLRCMELLRNTPVVGTVLNVSTAARPAYR